MLALLGAHHIFHISGLRVNVSQDLWIVATLVIYGCRFSSFVAFCADNADTTICCASQANTFLEDVSNLEQICSSFSS